MDKKRNRRPKSRPPFGERLYEARLRAGYTQAELGERVGMSQRTIANWEIRENSSPTTDQLVKLSDVLDVSLDELLRGDAEAIRRKPGPKGKLVRVLEEVSMLPMAHRKEVTDLIELMVRGRKSRLAKKADEKAEAR